MPPRLTWLGPRSASASGRRPSPGRCSGRQRGVESADKAGPVGEVGVRLGRARAAAVPSTSAHRIAEARGASGDQVGPCSWTIDGQQAGAGGVAALDLGGVWPMLLERRPSAGPGVVPSGMQACSRCCPAAGPTGWRRSGRRGRTPSHTRRWHSRLRASARIVGTWPAAIASRSSGSASPSISKKMVPGTSVGRRRLQPVHHAADGLALPHGVVVDRQPGARSDADDGHEERGDHRLPHRVDHQAVEQFGREVAGSGRWRRSRAVRRSRG